MQLDPAVAIPIPGVDAGGVRLVEAVAAEENYLLCRSIISHMCSAAVRRLGVWHKPPARGIEQPGLLFVDNETGTEVLQIIWDDETLTTDEDCLAASFVIREADVIAPQRLGGCYLFAPVASVPCPYILPKGIFVEGFLVREAAE